MKIEIEFDNSYNASLVIDGRKMTIDSKPGQVSLKGVSSDELDSTLGGIVAGEIYSKIASIQQAWAVAGEIAGEVTTWGELEEEAADEG